MRMSSTVHVRVGGEVPDRVAELVLDRPAALGALDTDTAVALAASAASLAGRADCSAVVLTSTAERAFCVGADLKERAAFGAEQMLAQRPVFRSLFEGLYALPMPLIAAVHGYALGGGFELALAADLIVADRTAVFGLPETGVGLVPGGGGTQLLSRRLGLAVAAEVILAGARLSAERAHRLGLVCRLADADVRAESFALAAEVAGKAPTALRAAKRALREGYELPLGQARELEDVAWRRAVGSPDRAEGIAAFVGKRAPRWGHADV